MDRHFGQWLKFEIEERLVSQAEFARHSGIPFGTINYWIAQAAPRMHGLNQARLAKALGIPRGFIYQKLFDCQESESARRSPAGRRQRRPASAGL